MQNPGGPQFRRLLRQAPAAAAIALMVALVYRTTIGHEAKAAPERYYGRMAPHTTVELHRSLTKSENIAQRLPKRIDE